MGTKLDTPSDKSMTRDRDAQSEVHVLRTNRAVRGFIVGYPGGLAFGNLVLVLFWPNFLRKEDFFAFELES